MKPSEIEIGDIFQSLDPRENGRRVRVISKLNSGKFLVYSEYSKRMSSISPHNLCKQNNRGYSKIDY